MTIERMLGWIILLLATLIFRKSTDDDSFIAGFICMVITLLGFGVGITAVWF